MGIVSIRNSLKLKGAGQEEGRSGGQGIAKGISTLYSSVSLGGIDLLAPLLGNYY